MLEFLYTITDPVGVHARPAGRLARKVAELTSTVTIYKGEKKADVKRLMALMALGIKCGDTIRVTVEGDNEASDIAELEGFLKENFF